MSHNKWKTSKCLGVTADLNTSKFSQPEVYIFQHVTQQLQNLKSVYTQANSVNFFVGHPDHRHAFAFSWVS